MKFKNTGFSLIEVVVAMAVVSINVLGFMSLQSSFSTTKTREATFEEINDSGKIIQRALDDQKTCSTNLIDKEIGVEFTEGLFKPKRDPSDLQSFIKSDIRLIPDTFSNKFSIKSYKLVSDSGQDFLEVDYEINPNIKKRIGQDNLINRYPLHLSRDPSGNIVDCQGSFETDDAELLAADYTCETNGGDMLDGVCSPVSDKVEVPDADECEEGATYKLVYENGTPTIKCVKCTVTRLWLEYKCEKKIDGMQYVNVCYYKSSCAENTTATFGEKYYSIGQMRGAKVLDMVEFLTLGVFSNDKGGDAGRKRNCEKKRLPCPGETTAQHDPIGISYEGKQTAKDSSENALDHYLDLKKAYESGNMNDAYMYFERLKLASDEAVFAGNRATEALQYLDSSESSAIYAAKEAQRYADEAKAHYKKGFDLLK